MIEKLVSSGQTGADIAALDVARRHGFPHGGWCPKGRKSEAGRIPDCYELSETPSAGYLQRTEWNARDSDGTVVFTQAAKVTGGSAKTLEYARKHGRPAIHIARTGGLARQALQDFVREHGIKVLNVAGSREAKEPGIHGWVIRVLEEAFFGEEGQMEKN